MIYGENAQGKTNLLEALAYLSCGKSPRARTDRDMIRFGGQAAVMTAGVFVREREFQVRAELSREQRRKLLINQVPVKTGAELSRVYNTVFFCPEDLLLIREGAAARRRFLVTPSPSCGQDTRRRLLNIIGRMSTRPGFSGMRRSGQTCWTRCRSSMSGW